MKIKKILQKKVDYKINGSRQFGQFSRLRADFCQHLSLSFSAPFCDQICKDFGKKPRNSVVDIRKNF